MNRILTKQQSRDLIEKLNLNRIEESVFKKGEVFKVKDYIIKNRYKSYSLRDRSHSSGKSIYGLTAYQVLDQCYNYDMFSLNESLIEADKNHMVLQGSIEITKDWVCRASLSDEIGVMQSYAEDYPKYNLNYDMIENSDPCILGLKEVINYCISHELFDMIVEFSLFSTEVGVNRENLIIWELRNY